ncbi:MAG: glutamate--tRNA ligase [Bacteroidetes bacterium]|nr:glutamate--tRNA ligase [Bacteroidota bacterium]
MSQVRVRFAPSPTGALHIGGVRTALFNYLFARKNNGINILRIEDTDQTRFVPGAENYIIESLKWLGITFDEGVHIGGEYGPYRQSDRKPMYRQYVEQLVASGHAYYAFDTPEELEEMRQRLKDSGMSPQYDATSRMSMKNSLTLSADEVKLKLDAGVPYVIRIKLPRKEEVRFNDLIRGWVSFNTAQLDDKVLMKNDGMPTYHMANIVDDHFMKITHVIRGEEWLSSAPLHVMLYKYLGWEDTMPQFAHLPLILKPEGNGKLSKRDGDRLGFPVFPLEWKDPNTGEISSGYRETGYEPEAVINFLALLGWHPSDNQELFSIEELINAFSLERISKNGAKFDIDKAKWFNHQYLMKRTDEDIAKELLPIFNNKGISTDLSYLTKVVSLTKEKVTFWKEIADIAEYFFKTPTQFDTKVVEKKWKGSIPENLLKFVTRLQNISDFNAQQIESIFHSFAEENEINAGSLMQPLRLAVSGQAGGPPLFEMLELLGKDNVINRIKWACDNLSASSQS